MRMMEAKEVLTNLKNWGCWEFSSYKLRKEEADVIMQVLQEKVDKEREENDEKL